MYEAFFNLSYVFLIPIFSILFLVLLNPAVSINLKFIPFKFIWSSIISLVVPAISLTIALSSFSKVFNRVDFPEFGGPIIAIGIPFFKTLPQLNESVSFDIVFSILFSNSLN